MPAPLPGWFQRLPDDLRHRLDLAEAAAREARLETHADRALDLVSILSPRTPFDDALDEYLEVMTLAGEDAEAVRTRTLSLLGEPGGGLGRGRPPGSSFHWKYATPLGALRFIQRRRRREAEEELWMELAAARAEEAVIESHVEHALRFHEILQGEAPPPRSISYYLDRLEVASGRAKQVYQRALARLAEELLPRLPGSGE
ncbi:MAG: hypothetical protein ACREKN_09370 [Longimicrobiaceae bacterium]